MYRFSLQLRRVLERSNDHDRRGPCLARLGTRDRLSLAHDRPGPEPATWYANPAARRRGGSRPMDQPADRLLGWLSESEEVGDRGPGTVSPGIGDKGGASYGSFQLSSEQQDGRSSNVELFVQKYYPTQFAGLTVNSPKFQQTWKDLGQGANARDFQAKQHQFIQDTHYDPIVQDLQNDLGIDPTLRSAVLQNVIWSTAVQHGRRGGRKVIETAIRDLAQTKRLSDLTDEAIIRAIYAERGRTDAQGKLVHFQSKKTSDDTRARVARRFRREQAAALAALAQERRSPRQRLLDQAKARQKGLSKRVRDAAEEGAGRPSRTTSCARPARRPGRPKTSGSGSRKSSRSRRCRRLDAHVSFQSWSPDSSQVRVNDRNKVPHTSGSRPNASRRLGANRHNPLSKEEPQMRLEHHPNVHCRNLGSQPRCPRLRPAASGRDKGDAATSHKDSPCPLEESPRRVRGGARPARSASL